MGFFLLLLLIVAIAIAIGLVGLIVDGLFYLLIIGVVVLALSAVFSGIRYLIRGGRHTVR